MGLERESPWPEEFWSSQGSRTPALATPAAQSVSQRLMEGRQAVMREMLITTKVQMEGVTTLKGRREVGAL